MGDQDDQPGRPRMPVGSEDGGDGRRGMSVAAKVVVASLVVVVLAVAGMVAFGWAVLSIPDEAGYKPNGSVPLEQRPSLEEFHAELWPLGHELVRQIEATAGVTFTLKPGGSSVTTCNLDQGWMEDSAAYIASAVDVTTLDAIGRRVLSARFPAYSTHTYTAGDTVLHWSNPEGSSFDVWILRDATVSVGWSSGCALSSVYPPPYTKPWPTGLPSPPTPLPDPEAPTVTASPLPSSPAARPTQTSSPS